MTKNYVNAKMLLRKVSYCSPDVNAVCSNLIVPQCIFILPCDLTVPLHL